MSKEIRVSEHFYSLQGEGPTTGMPSIFLRLQACNLMCGGRGTEKDKKLHNGATWRCDTIECWRQGEAWKVRDLAKHFQTVYSTQLAQGAQLVVTGGEPLLQQNAIPDLLDSIQPHRTEVETNGTITPNMEVRSRVNCFNVSPKLANSGMRKARRVRPIPLQTFALLQQYGGAIFKFVLTSEYDFEEMMRDYIDPFNIARETTWLMPGCSNQQQYANVAPLVAELCKKHGFMFSGRLQINIWDEVTGV